MQDSRVVSARRSRIPQAVRCKFPPCRLRSPVHSDPRSVWRTRSTFCCSISATGSARRSVGDHSAWLSSGVCSRRNLPCVSRSSGVRGRSFSVFMAVARLIYSHLSYHILSHCYRRLVFNVSSTFGKIRRSWDCRMCVAKPPSFGLPENQVATEH